MLTEMVREWQTYGRVLFLEISMRLRMLIPLAVAMIVTSSAFAGGTASGLVVSYEVTGYYLTSFSVTNNPVGSPACANPKSGFAINTGNQYGVNILNALMSAKAANLTVTVWGSGYCTLSSGTEDVAWIVVSGNPSP